MNASFTCWITLRQLTTVNHPQQQQTLPFVVVQSSWIHGITSSSKLINSKPYVYTTSDSFVSNTQSGDISRLALTAGIPVLSSNFQLGHIDVVPTSFECGLS